MIDPVRPRAAATLILIDRRTRTPQVLMGRRHGDLAFMPGKFVFPGGRVEPGDYRMNALGALDPIVEAKLRARRRGAAASIGRAAALAAIRETFEETGLAVGSAEHGAPPSTPAGTWARFAALGLYPTLDDLRFVARAVTPPGNPRRFDTRFFTVDATAIGRTVDGVVGADTELTELVWLPLAEAVHLDLPSITAIVLDELSARMRAGFGVHLPVPFFYHGPGGQVRRSL